MLLGLVGLPSFGLLGKVPGERITQKSGDLRIDRPIFDPRDLADLVVEVGR